MQNAKVTRQTEEQTRIGCGRECGFVYSTITKKLIRRIEHVICAGIRVKWGAIV